jgi:hypothetical protein
MRNIFKRNSFCFFAVVFLMGMYVIPVLAVQDDQDQQGEARAERAKQLEAKLSDVRDNFFSLRDKLKETTDEAGASLEAELKVARDNLGQRYKELQSTYKEELGSLEGSLDAVWKQLDGKRDQAKKLTTAEIDKVRKEWETGYEKLQRVHSDQVQQIQAELIELEKQANDASQQMSYQWMEKRATLRKEYESSTKQMRQSYQLYISSLHTESQRMQTAAKAAGKDVRVEMLAKADEIDQKTNAAYDELISSYNSVANTANDYFQQTQTRFKNASDQAKGKIEDELDEVSNSMCEIHCAVATSYEQYRDSLNSQLESAESRASAAADDVRQDLDQTVKELTAKRDEINKKTVAAYDAAAKALEKEIASAKSELKKADQQTRSELVKMIEKQQAELDQFKQKLEGSQ